MQLSDLIQGQSAEVEQISGNGAFRRRVLEMGILKGVRVHVEKYAPLRDPIEIIVKGNHISLRVEEAAKISVANVR